MNPELRIVNSQLPKFPFNMLVLNLVQDRMNVSISN